MKFNWKANWEILLVLVIIVIGIVITTIAAIRNKDKHLPYQTGTDEADLQQQLFAPPGANSDDPERHGGKHQALSPPQPRTTKAQQNRASKTTQIGRAEHQAEELATPTMGALDQYSPPATMAPAADSPEFAGEQLTTTSELLPLNPTPLSAKRVHLSASNKRHIGQLEAKSPKPTRPTSSDPMGETLDDIHTTRSALATANITQQQQQLFLATPGASPSVAFHGPYGGASSSFLPGDGLLAEARFTNLTQVGQRQQPAAESNQMANLLLMQQQQQQDQFVANEANQYRGYTGTLPISLLLGDLLKMTTPASVPAAQDLEPSQRATTGSILQQIRSLPGPLMSLLGQSLAAMHNQQHQQQQHQQVNHEASESNQNADYRVSMSSPADLHSIFSRSLSRSTPDSLPAFPPPKGVPQPWVPPTSGGNLSHSEAQASSSADFIASNTAGFVRALQLQQQQQQQPQPQSSDQQQQYPSADPFAGQQHQAAPSADPDPLQQEIYQQQPQPQYQQQQQQQQQFPSQDQVLATNQQQANHLFHAMQQQQQQQQQFAQYQHNNPVPLGFNPQLQLQQQQPRLQIQQSDFGGLESSPKVSVSQASFVNRQPIVLRNQQQQSPPKPIAGRTNRRRKRSAYPMGRDEREREFEAYASKYSRDSRDEELDDDEDSQPLSVVSPDGRPLSNKRFRSAGRMSAQQSQRAPSHVERPNGRSNQRPSGRENKRPAAPRERMQHAGSDLMSRLLGTASSSMSSNADDADGIDVDMMDDDEEAANERRKEEQDDAEFGISNDSNANDISSPQSPDEHSRLDNHQATDEEAAQPRHGSASSAAGTGGGGSGTGYDAGSQRRNGPTRSDIEFYGHPGEETRQLKYGILGSGNYEVVNGGIYPEADESTAAVNSVANYVRKPGLLAGLPKMLQSTNHHQQQHQAAAAAFMPGGRIGGGSYLSGSASSSSPQDIAELAAALMVPSGTGKGGVDEMSGPALLQLIGGDGGQYLNEANLPLISQLSSGSSARSTHASRDDFHELTNHRKQHDNNSSSKKKKKRKGNEIVPSEDDDHEEQEKNGIMQLQQSSTVSQSARRAPGDAAASTGAGNQFNKYQISPSKKVTIFSDQDLDSAPSSLLIQTLDGDER